MRKFLLVLLALAGAAGLYWKDHPEEFSRARVSAADRTREMKDFNALMSETLGTNGEKNREAVKTFNDPGISHQMAAVLARAEGDTEKELTYLKKILEVSRDSRLLAETQERITEIRSQRGEGAGA